MYLIRLVYASKIADNFDMGDVDNILTASNRNNSDNGVTGVLCYSNRYFLQCLEGSRVNVNMLYHNILKDQRHFDPSILQYEEIDERDFPDWSMGYIPPEIVSGALVSQFSGRGDFEPYSMSGESCYRLLKRLAQMGITHQ